MEPRGIDPLTSSMPFRAPDAEARETKEDREDACEARPSSSAIVGSPGHSRGNDRATDGVDGPTSDVVEMALSDALTKASSVGQWTWSLGLLGSSRRGGRREPASWTSAWHALENRDQEMMDDSMRFPFLALVHWPGMD